MGGVHWTSWNLDLLSTLGVDMRREELRFSGGLDWARLEVIALIEHL